MKHRLTALLMALLMIILTALPVSAVSGSDVSETDTAPAAPETIPAASSSDVSSSDGPGVGWDTMRDITAAELIEEIHLGWNLGESLDSWSSDAGYSDYYNANAYQMILRYDNANGERNVSIANTFKSDNTCSFKWQTGLIDTDSDVGLGDIGFEIWNLTVEEDTEVTVRCKKAQLIRRNKAVVDFDELLGDHTVTISKYGTVAVLTTKFPSNLSRTYGITDGTFEVELELVDFPQKDYGKAAYFESLWNNPPTTKEMITEVKAAGFNAVRIPVTYFNHVASDSSIDSGWLDRVQEVVNYCISQDMFCIIDMHNDGSTTGWLRVNTSDSDAVTTKYASLWKQIAERFRDYGDRLLFQGFNELTNGTNQWTYPGEEDAAWVNNLNQLFVDTVRSTGGNNSSRCLVLMPYAGSYDQQILSALKLPNDSAADRLIVSVNAYVPEDFSWEIDMGETDTSYSDVVEFTAEGKAEVDDLFASLDGKFVSRGVPVLVSEFGTDDKTNTADRCEHAAYFVSRAKEYSIPCFWWDDGDMLMRKSLNWKTPEIVDAMVSETSTHVKTLSYHFADAYYNEGLPVIPKLTVGVYGGDIVASNGDLVSGSDVPLTEGSDYTVVFENNTAIGTGRAIVTGLGRYSGIHTVEFEITQKPSERGLLGNLAKDNPDLPLVVMLSFPIILALAGLVVYQEYKRRERSKVEAVVGAAMEEEFAARRSGGKTQTAAVPDYELPDDDDFATLDDDFDLPDGNLSEKTGQPDGMDDDF